MRILKIRGKDEETIKQKIQEEYGDMAVIVHSQQEKERGLLGWLKPAKTVITIAVEEEEAVEESNTEENALLSAWHEYAANKNQEQMQLAKKDSDTNEDAYHLLVSLKQQMDKMEHTVQNLNKVDNIVNMQAQEKQLDIEKESTIIKLLRERLLEEGITKPIAEQLLTTVQGVEDIESIVAIIYNEIEKILNQHLVKDTLEKIVFFIGPTGVGKTTTIAKLTADYVLNQEKKVVLFTADTYRIAAIEQLKTYADIVGTPIEIIYQEDEIEGYIKKWENMDHIFIDTAGRSHKNTQQLEDMKTLLSSISKKQVILVVNASTSYKDIQNIIDTYTELTEDIYIIITKLDETDQMGNVINIAYYAQRPILYLTHGQNVPVDITSFNVETYTRELMERLSYE